MMRDLTCWNSGGVSGGGGGGLDKNPSIIFGAGTKLCFCPSILSRIFAF